jgi:uncharacterized membrane protein YdjX (TVP38/TMEM64 family)
MLPGTLLYVYAGSAIADVGRAIAGHARTGRTGEALLWVGLLATVAVTALLTHFARREIARGLHADGEH